METETSSAEGLAAMGLLLLRVIVPFLGWLKTHTRKTHITDLGGSPLNEQNARGGHAKNSDGWKQQNCENGHGWKHGFKP